VTGSSGLIGSEAMEHFDGQGEVVGVDNNMRREFFGRSRGHSAELGAAEGSDEEVYARKPGYTRPGGDRGVVSRAPAQPSHDKAQSVPILDFEVNALER
jgi:CDP-paratose 2-epimerase